MEGVEILVTQEFAISYAFNWDMYLGIILMSTIISTALFGMILFKQLGFWSFLNAFILGIIVSGLIGLIPAVCTLPDEYETQYKVTISDEVSMNEFLKRYEIVDQEGKIYTVREREAIEDGEWRIG